MSKKAEQAAYNYAKENGTLGYDYNQIYDAAKNGYEQAEKDIITLIESRLSELLGDAQPTPILRYELQDLIKKIREEE